MGRTMFLMIALMLLFMYVGDAIAGPEGMRTAFLMACGVNLFSYFFSDTLVLKQYKAVKADQNTAPELYHTVESLAQRANLPMPKVYIIPEQTPNAFATGRSPNHAAVAATEGLLNLMSPEEIEGVLAHEMTHVKNRDILISTIAAAFAGALTMLGNSAKQNGTSQANRKNRFGLLSIAFAPIAASIIQMSISRTREYKADEGSAYLTNHPEWLMSALSKLEGYAKNYQMQNASKQTAHMFIVNPFSGVKSLANLFSTHPTTEKRIAKLAEIQEHLITKED